LSRNAREIGYVVCEKDGNPIDLREDQERHARMLEYIEKQERNETESQPKEEPR